MLVFVLPKAGNGKQNHQWGDGIGIAHVRPPPKDTSPLSGVDLNVGSQGSLPSPKCALKRYRNANSTVQLRVSFARWLFSQLFEQERGSSPDGTKAHEGRVARSSAPQIVRAWA